MPAIPDAYAWLRDEAGPKMLDAAKAEIGVVEAPGEADNPKIMGWAKEAGLDRSFSADAVPWCGLFMAVVAKRAGKTLPAKPLWALSWADFGTPVQDNVPMLGDVLTFKREGGGHVGIYVGEDPQAFHVLGGNQSDRVCIVRIFRDRFYRARRPVYSIAQPANVRRVFLAPSGTPSTNEA